jgi:hypothetical protein
MRRRYNVPSSGRRGCLCRDRDTYSIECCDDQDYMRQGIGNLTGPIGFLLQENGDYILQENNSKIEL